MFLRKKAAIVGITEHGETAALREDLCTRIAARLTRDMTVLELACGTGQMTLPLCGSVALWEATDVSKANIAKARQIPHSDRLRYTVMDPARMPYEHSTFDAVVATNALLCMPYPEPALREIRRVLRPGGLLFAPTNMYGGRRLGLRMRATQLGGRRIFHYWTPSQFLELIRWYGFITEKAVLLPDTVAPVCYVEAQNSK